MALGTGWAGNLPAHRLRLRDSLIDEFAVPGFGCSSDFSHSGREVINTFRYDDGRLALRSQTSCRVLADRTFSPRDAPIPGHLAHRATVANYRQDRLVAPLNHAHRPHDKSPEVGVKHQPKVCNPSAEGPLRPVSRTCTNMMVLAQGVEP